MGGDTATSDFDGYDPLTIYFYSSGEISKGRSLL